MKQYVYADLDEIVFDGRERGYGAYQMREKYNRHLMRATLIAFLLFLSVTALPKVITWVMPEEVAEANSAPPPEERFEPTMLALDDLKEVEDPEPITPAPPEPKVKINIKTIEYLTPTPTADEMVVDEASMADIDSLDLGMVSDESRDGDLDLGNTLLDIANLGGPGGPGTLETQLTGDGNGFVEDTFMLLDKEPRPVNMDMLKQMIGYPELAKEARIEGKVILRIQTDKYGNYVRHKVLKDPHAILTNAVTSRIQHLRMTPGIQGGKPIPVWVTVPFVFTLTGN